MLSLKKNKMKPFKIVFLGCNGSGKTTILNYTRKQLEKKGQTVDVVVMGWKNFTNPFLKFISKFKTQKISEMNKGRLKRFRQRSFFFYCIYYLELLQRYKLIKNSTKDFVLIDRYFYEELMFANGFAFNLFKKITPPPDKCFILKTSLKVLHKRGHNLSQKELDRFYSHFNKLKKDFDLIFIDSSGSVQKVFKEINKHLPTL